MTQQQKRIIMDIKKRVLLKNNIHWLNNTDRAEFQVEEGRVPITDDDLFEIVDQYINFSVFHGTISKTV
jgi:hypothetical protein